MDKETTQEQTASGRELRRAERHNQHLVVQCRLSGDHGLPTGPRILAEVLDLSTEGMALSLGSASRPAPSTVQEGCHFHLEFRIPNDPRVITTVGEVRWIRKEAEDDPGVVRIGVRLLTGRAELAQTLQNLVSAGKCEKQFLWNLWETYSAAA